MQVGTYVYLETPQDPGFQDRSVLKGSLLLDGHQLLQPREATSSFPSSGQHDQDTAPSARTEYKDEGPGQVARFGVWPGGWNPRIVVNS